MKKASVIFWLLVTITGAIHFLYSIVVMDMAAPVSMGVLTSLVSAVGGLHFLNQALSNLD